jgi:hypothetical protein
MNKTVREIISLFLVALLITFALSVFGVGFSLQATDAAFGESKILRWVVYLIPVVLTWYLAWEKLFKKFNKRNTFKHSALVYLFWVVIGSFIIKLKVNTPVYFLQQDYLAYKSENKLDVDEAFKTIRSNAEAHEPVFVPSDNYVIYKSEVDIIPDKSEESDLYVTSSHFAYWQTPVLLGYSPNGKLASDISFHPRPIASIKDFFRYLFQLVPVFYLELFLKSFFSLSLLLISLYSILLYYFLRHKEIKKMKVADIRLMDGKENTTSTDKYTWSNKKVPDRLLQLFRKMYHNPNMTEEEVTHKLEQVADYQQKHSTNVSK